ncbi:MAG: 1-(5-phosphoribosyl)-5-[(5-phosphoribosylamino)methylideneamino] imidazole-4-carboxamide isomerase [Planctomycetota bacterium]|nr:1-(5-phosphoribosyl)-5-[(5-phosphoribosylamino)methylideneamino] imidazole-4-carboxamide isomerase [Planctomycetota bacterium]
MDILPAIDVRGGKVVRLARGDYDAQTTYSDDPVSVARQFVAAGARWIHMVDLDAARSGVATNADVIGAVAAAVGPGGVKVQCGGGLRSTQAVRAMLGVADRLVIGSAAMKNWAWFESLLADAAIPNDRLALGLDARDGLLAAEGWTEQLELKAVDLARRVRGSGLGAIVYTDIARDGMLTGVNVPATAAVAGATDVPVIASGGVAGLGDVIACRQAGCAGMIIGKAWYEGRIDLAEACRLADAAG